MRNCLKDIANNCDVHKYAHLLSGCESGPPPHGSNQVPTIAERWGELSAERRLRGAPLSTADGLIAATSLEHGLVLVTRNVRDFGGLGLQLLNPFDLP